MFATDAGLAMLRRANGILIDGTFQVSPAIFTQVLLMHAHVDGVVWPVVHWLLPGKKEEFYSTAFRQLTAIVALDNIAYCVCDFEIGLQNCIRDVRAQFSHDVRTFYRSSVSRFMGACFTSASPSTAK